MHTELRAVLDASNQLCLGHLHIIRVNVLDQIGSNIFHFRYQISVSKLIDLFYYEETIGAYYLFEGALLIQNEV